MVREIREDIRQKVKEGMDAWEAERVALRMDIDALRAIPRPEPLDSQALVRDIRQDLQQKVQQGMDAWETERVALRADMDALQAIPQPEPLDKEGLVREIREDIRQKIKESMDAWEAERTALGKAMDDLRQATAESSSTYQARIDEIAASLVTAEDLQAIKEDVRASLSREIPAAAAKVIREEIVALMQR